MVPARTFLSVLISVLVLTAIGYEGGDEALAQTLSTPSRSTSIALTSDSRRLVVVNQETDTVSVIRVRNDAGQDVAIPLAEIPVGIEPHCVAISPDDSEAYITNSVSGTVTVIALGGIIPFAVLDEIPVGVEPRGCAISPNGTRLYVANFTRGAVSVVNLASRQVVRTIFVGGNPFAIAVTNDGDGDDLDERVFVTRFFAQLIPGGPGEGFDNGKRGGVRTFPVSKPNSVTSVFLAPFNNTGFTANRTNFCPQTIPPPLVLHDDIFCPDLNAPPGDPAIIADPQGAFPNQLGAALIRSNFLYLPNIGAQPEPPVVFNVNVQGLVNLVNTNTLSEALGRRVNINQQIATEIQPANPTASLDRLFAGDFVAIDANQSATTFLIVSRGNNYVIRAALDVNGRLNIGAPDNVVRFQTGNNPTGVVISGNGQRAYVNNQFNVSVTAINLQNNSVITRDIPSGRTPAPGTFDHAVLVGQLAFFTALGIPDNNFFGTPIRQIVPLEFRGKQSDNGWSSCASCHPDGLSDGVTWLFAAGPRQTIPLDGMFAKDNPSDQRPLNWSAVRSSNTDFNNNSRGVQGGCGFASDDFAPECLGTTTPANPNIYDHGINQGASDALDAQTLWIQVAVDTLLQPRASNLTALGRGRTVFADNCASCHGGQKWTKSQIFYRDNPAFNRDPAQMGVPLDPGVVRAGGQILALMIEDLENPGTFNVLQYLEDVGTFDPDNPLEIRGDGGARGTIALGAAGFNVPSLLGLRFNAPFFHNGAAQNLNQVFNIHELGAGTIGTTLNAQQEQDLRVFLNSIDGRTRTFRSEGDDFRDANALP